MRVVYNGNSLSLQRVNISKWVSDEALAAHADNAGSGTGNEPVEISMPDMVYPEHTLIGAVAGAGGGSIGTAIIGAVIGFFQDVDDYMEENP